MRSIEDKGCLNLNNNNGTITHETSAGNYTAFEFHKNNALTRSASSHNRTALGKPTPSKWDDAQKWLVNLSRGEVKSHPKSSPRNSNADDRRLIAPPPPVPKKEYSSGEDEGAPHDQFEEETKNVDSIWRVNKAGSNSFDKPAAVRSVCVRDMGTEMTPIASQEPSRTATPIRATTPAARSPISSGPSTPVRCQNNVMDISSVPSIESLSGNKGENGRGNSGVEANGGDNVVGNKSGDEVSKKSPMESRAVAWDEAERAKYMARYKREEVKIQAWENHQNRKAEMQKRKVEVKADRLKSRAQEKYTNKLAATRRIAEEKRANAEAKLNEKAVKTSKRADYIRRTGHLPSSCSFKLPSLCW